MRSSANHWVRRLRFRMKTFLGTRPWLYMPLYRQRASHRDLLVDASTDLCVEGFPRSANSFTVSAIAAAQSEPLDMAHHAHVSANVMQACRLGVPALVLIRAPKDAVVSLTALNYQTQGASPEEAAGLPPIPFRDQLKAWIAFYRSLEPYQGEYVVAPFEVAIDDLAPVIRYVNKRFGLTLEVFEHTDENVRSIHQGRGYHAGPSERRTAIKKAVRSAFEDAQANEEAVGRCLQEAQHVHKTWLDMTPLHTPT